MIGGTPISELPPSSFAYCEPGDEAVSTRCHFPIRDRNGKPDRAHVRNALARLTQSPFGARARRKVETAAKELGIDVAGKSWVALKASALDDDAFRLCAIPFSGPVPVKGAPRGADADQQWFSPATDIRPGWFSVRPVDWHHRQDGAVGPAVIAKAVDLGNREGPGEPDEDGYWVTVWLDRQSRNLAMIAKLAERGATLYGSSESVPRLATVKAMDGRVLPWAPNLPGEIVSWPYVRQTLSPAPRNTHSIIVPLKGTLDDLASLGESPDPSFWSDIEDDLRSLGASLRDPSVSDRGAKAGRSPDDLQAALAALIDATEKAIAVAR